VLTVLSRPQPPPIPALARAGWGLARLPLGRIQALATVGLLPPLLRERFGLRWTRAQELELRALAAGSRAVSPLMPKTLRQFGPTYLEWRRDAIAAGGMAAAPA
jgi:uncharacterized protein (DUF2236 family)